MRKKSDHPVAKHKDLDAAQKLMLQKGFSATSLDQICRLAGLTKGSFFHYFKSKEELGKAVLERFCGSSQKKMTDCACSQKEIKDPLERIYGYIDSMIDMARSKGGVEGCLLGSFVTELAETYPAIRHLCHQGFDDWAQILKKDLKEAVKLTKKNINIQSLAEYMIAVTEGSQILARAQKDKKVIEHSMVHLKEYLKFIFGR